MRSRRTLHGPMKTDGGSETSDRAWASQRRGGLADGPTDHLGGALRLRGRNVQMGAGPQRLRPGDMDQNAVRLQGRRPRWRPCPRRDRPRTRSGSSPPPAGRAAALACRRWPGRSPGRCDGPRPAVRRDGPAHTGPPRRGRRPGACRRRTACGCAVPGQRNRAARPGPSRPGTQPLAETHGHAVERLRPSPRRGCPWRRRRSTAGRRRGAATRPWACVQALIAWIFSSG